MTYDVALSRMAALCSTGEHCESDIRRRLQRADVAEEDIERLVEYLYEEHYLDTARYCRAYAHDQLRFAHWGRVRIQEALRQKGLPESDIRTALGELPQEEYRGVLADLLRQKLRTLHDADDYVRRNKLIRYAAGRGFEMDEIVDEVD